ncbi:MAG TPA: lipopolysaccharide biosynthesis protein [Tepidisphaeraceae bacterium]|nr:lipopolysaccharide biosynthesis protein [Tepidisphaeraceae bacterium]
MRRDVASSYFASITRIASWVVVSALVYRVLGAPEFALLALIRGTIGLLNYVSLGLAPAFIHRASRVTEEPGRTSTGDDPLRTLYANAYAMAMLGGAVGLILTVAYARTFAVLYHVPADLHASVLPVVLFMGIGLLLRLTSDASGAVLQVRCRIALDNALVAAGDAAWVILAVACVLVLRTKARAPALLGLVGLTYALSGLITVGGRFSAADRLCGVPRWRLVSRSILIPLLSFGAMVTMAQLADYLYAPTDYILINRLLDPVDVANYAPAVQLDSGLLLLVTGLSAVLLPKAAIAHGSGDAKTVRRYYLVGTVASFVLLAVASTAVWLLSPWIFRLWLGNPMPVTQSILPIVLLNTVIGGSSAVGRSILLAVGRVRPFTISVLIAGVTNVVCSYAFLRWLHWGLRGIVLGTVVAVVGRCLIWMPWYVLKTLRENRESP